MKNMLISYKFHIDNEKKITIKVFFNGPLAQLVEQFPFKEWVDGSSPSRLTISNQWRVINYNFIHPFAYLIYPVG